jgi:sugar/nucleoside kinase (ribokinase family)
MDAAIFGLIVADLIASPMNLRDPPAPGVLVKIKTIELTTGGNVCNTGIAMAKLGARVAAAGVVGQDILGAALVDRLQRAGLDVSCVFADARAQTSSTVVAVEPGGERCFFHTPGATALLDPDAFARCMPMFGRSAYVQVGYFGLLPSLDAHLAPVLRQLKHTFPQTKIALDTVNPPAARELLEPALPHLDLFCPSRTEAQALTGESEPDRMVAAFRAAGVRSDALIGIKLDADGCYLDDGARQVFCPAYPIDCVDTTGAGDTWFGGLLVALQKNMPLDQAGRFANRVAADCCTALGASAGVRPFEETIARV